MSDDLRARILEALTTHLAAKRTVRADSERAASLALRYPEPTITEHGGERWARFAHVPDESASFTVHYGQPWDEMWKTAAIGDLADAVMAALGDQQGAYEDLLASLWLYVDWRFVTKQLTTEQKVLFADSVDAHSARLAAREPTYGEPTKADRWWDK